MIGEYARLTPAQLDRALKDPEWAAEFVNELIDAEMTGRPDPASARSLDIDKSWDALRFLLERAGFPVNIVHGEEAIPGADDWGYGPPRYLTPDQVRLAADALTKTTGAALIEDVTPEDLARADTYPLIVWERGESLDYVSHYYDALVPFFQAAAREGDAILVWLD